MANNSVFTYDGGEFGEQCVALCRAQGFFPAPSPELALFALAPCLRRRLSREELRAPELGTLVFHPSLLPFRRGPDAIRWAVNSHDPVTGVTWFWADDGLDHGPICEQEVIRLSALCTPTPGKAYKEAYIPAGLRALERALSGIRAGLIRRVPQDDGQATYESFYRGP